MKKGISLVLAIAVVGFAGSASAAEAQGSQGFVRAELGKANLKINDLGSSKDTSYGVGGGYWFNANWAVEGTYNRLYDKSVEGASISVTNFTAGGVAKKNFGKDGNGFYIGGRAGYGFSRAKVSARGNGFSYSSSVSSNDAYYGAMLGYDVSRDFGIGLNYTQYRAFSDAKVNNLGISAEYRF